MLTRKFMSFFAVLMMVGTLSSCITTTTGGFLVEASDDQALQDYIQLAIGYYNVGDMTGARYHVNNALELDNRNTDAYNMLALIFQREGDLDLAEENFRTALSYDDSNSRARNNYAVLLFSLERYDDAYAELEKVVADTSYEGRSIAFENLGRSALRLNKMEDADRAFTRALQLNANLYVSSIELALVKFQQEHWDEARQIFRQYLTTAEFYNIPHTPRALVAGIQIEGYFSNQEFVDNFELILTTIYADSPEAARYQGLSNAN